jgi:NAD(P)-dependent dehydrogenase (short-subunit alcohol dehydrogenase family)
MTVPFHAEDALAVVTGAAGGIGAALAVAIAEAGARAVVITDVDETGLARTASHDTRLRPHPLDCTDRGPMSVCPRSIRPRFGGWFWTRTSPTSAVLRPCSP